MAHLETDLLRLLAPHGLIEDIGPDDAVRVFAVSDVHTDFKENREWLRSLPKQGPGSVLILAGDISNQPSLLEETLKSCKEKYQEVFFCVGNHDLWVSKGEGFDSSIHKLLWILELCKKMGVRTGAGQLTPHGPIICPLPSWYCPSFPGDGPGVGGGGAVDSFDAGCVWPPEVGSPDRPRYSLHPGIARFMGRLAQPALDFCAKTRAEEEELALLPSVEIISFSHFLPRFELYGGYPSLARVMGSDTLRLQVESLRPMAHIFGHSHMRVDRVISGTRFLQCALGYPRERWGRGIEPELIWSSRGGAAG